MSGLREVLAAISVQHQRIPRYAGSFGGMRCVGCDHLEGATDGPNSPRHAEHVAGEQATAVLDWLRARLASDEVREAVAEDLLTEHMDGDLLIAAGRSIGSEGSDVPINDARPSEVVWWATDAALTAVLAALEVER